ncbi:hypothetical protein E2C01_017550 [Portunus trituberculatus]|uniref:Uncharacterized protein n=1 Tax=Portunus trituberculatus TaxID=210409 RepID=A0A5B7DTS7_PORTR|nr:hypothetical protein [Portunus trituberculatus]
MAFSKHRLVAVTVHTRVTTRLCDMSWGDEDDGTYTSSLSLPPSDKLSQGHGGKDLLKSISSYSPDIVRYSGDLLPPLTSPTPHTFPCPLPHSSLHHNPPPLIPPPPSQCYSHPTCSLSLSLSHSYSLYKAPLILHLHHYHHTLSLHPSSALNFQDAKKEQGNAPGR